MMLKSQRRFWLVLGILGVLVIGSENRGWGQFPSRGRRVAHFEHSDSYAMPPLTEVMQYGEPACECGSHSCGSSHGHGFLRSHCKETLHWLRQAPCLRLLKRIPCHQGRECACPPKQFNAQGYCKVREGCNTRRDYSRVYSTGRSSSGRGASVEVEYFPEYEPCYPNFWLKR